MAGSFMPAPFVTTQAPPTPVVVIPERGRAATEATAGHDRIIWNLGSSDSPQMRARSLVAVVAGKYGVRPQDIRGPRRSSKLIQARFEAYLSVVDQCPEWSYTDIGQFFNKDHTTIVSAVKKHGAHKQPAPSPTGEDHNGSKISDAAARELARRARAGESASALGREFAVSEAAVRNMKNGRRLDRDGVAI
jgi:hypothetical protein